MGAQSDWSCLQVFAALSVSTGCLSYGICCAYTSSALAGLTSPASAVHLSSSQAAWMSEHSSTVQLLWILNLVNRRISVKRK